MRDPCVVWFIAYKLNPNVSLNRLEDRLLLQKIGYMVQEILGYNLGYKFSWYSYGPYSRTLSRDLHAYETACIARGNMLDDRSLSQLVDRFTSIYVKAQSLCKDEPMARTLEIIASIHMLAKNTYPPSTDPVADLLRIKPYIRRTCAEEIERMLIEEGIIDRLGSDQVK
ncbi:hypothetical protein ATG_05480 [Desulfurococcaceae archaeon AG1]|jgi:hypothetical protein|nr:hypothetical protein ATG_05480 [Desulfurococcaceae archaeon AG1]